MPKLHGVVTFVHNGTSAKGKDFTGVSIEGLFCFLRPGLEQPVVGDEINATLQVQSGKDNGKDTVSILAYQKVPAVNGAA